MNVIYDARGQRRLNGSGFAANHLIVELLEESDTIDIVLDLGGEYKYRIGDADLTAGKFFSPQVKSIIHFRPKRPWQPLSATDFETFLAATQLLGR